MQEPTETSSKTQTAPYVSYKTFRNFIDGLRQDSLPRTIDSSLMSNLSGGVQSQLRPALRYLHLVDDENRPQPRLAELLNATDEERPAVLRNILKDCYRFFVDENGDFGLSQETAMTFSRKLSETGLSGESVRRAEAFFIQLASEAGIEIPKRIVSGRTSASKPRTGKPTRQSTKKPTPKEVTSTTVQSSTPVTSRQHTDVPMTWKQKMKQSIVEKMTEKYPEFDPTWDAETQQKWFDGWQNAMNLIESEPDDSTNDSGIED
jgi:hypothetical protein